MLKVGITGGIGSGKSTVCKIFAALGIPVLHADDVAKHIVATDAEVRKAIEHHFGVGVYLNGTLQTHVLAARAFATAEGTAALNAIVHPAVAQYTKRWFAQQQAHYCIKEAAILIESGAYQHVDVVITVSCPTALRVQRVLQRDPSATEHTVMQRVAKQLTDEQRKTYCQYNIVNDDTTALLPQVLHIHESLQVHEKF